MIPDIIAIPMMRIRSDGFIMGDGLSQGKRFGKKVQNGRGTLRTWKYERSMRIRGTKMQITISALITLFPVLWKHIAVIARPRTMKRIDWVVRVDCPFGSIRLIR